MQKINGDGEGTPEGIVLVTGGAASGKSELGERICCLGGPRRLYLATMRPYGEEAHARIARHRAMRAHRGFETAERYRDLDRHPLQKSYDAALLEDTGNLVANQLFETGANPSRAAESVLTGIDRLAGCASLLVIVANEVFGGAEQFEDTGMRAYLEVLAKVHRTLARKAVTVVESVCGYPLWGKGALRL